MNRPPFAVGFPIDMLTVYKKFNFGCPFPGQALVCTRPFSRGSWLLVAALCLPLFLVGSCNVPHAFSRAQAATGDEAYQPVIPSAHQVSTLRKIVQLDPSSLLALGESEVMTVLEAPELKREDGPTEIWQYRSDSCVVDIYVDPVAGAVVHYELRQRVKAVLGHAGKISQPADDRQCVHSVIAQNHGLGQIFAALR